MERETALTIPCHWDVAVMRQILDAPVPKKAILVREVYGVLAEGGPVGHGRATSTVPLVTRDAAIVFRRWLKKREINFSYLLNAPYRTADSLDQRQRLDSYLDWVLAELRPDAVTISSLELMRRVRERDDSIRINISTIAGVKSARDLERYLEARPSRVVVHHDLGKDWASLLEVVEFGRDHGVAVELLVNESCLLHCPDRERHYTFLAGGPPNDTSFMTSCNEEKREHPWQFLLSGGAIRPEDVHLFEEMGVEHFKIAGRDREAAWLPEVVTAYQMRHYEGNFIRLLGTAPAIKAEKRVHLENGALNGFMAGYPSQATAEEKTDYAKRWIIRLWQEGNFFADGSDYAVVEGSLVLKAKGGHAVQAISG